MINRRRPFGLLWMTLLQRMERWICSPSMLCLRLYVWVFGLTILDCAWLFFCLIFFTNLLICLISVSGTKLAKTAVGWGGLHRILHQGKNNSLPQKTHYDWSISKLRSIISCLQMDPKALEALPEEKTTKMELKRGQVGFHWSTNKFQQR